MESLTGISNKISNERGNWKEIIIKNKIDSVIHLAANLIISEGEKYPKKYYRNNVVGTQNLLKACIKSTVKNFIFSSTAAIYKDGQFKVSENCIRLIKLSIF